MRLILICALGIFALGVGRGAVTSTTVWEIRATGSDANGGCFDAGVGSPGTDYSTASDNARVVIDNSSVSGATGAGPTAAITLTGYTVSAGDVGNCVQISGGTNFNPGFYVITAVNTGSNTWTLNGNVVTSGSGGGLMARMGGPLASPGKLAGNMLASNKAFVKYSAAPYLVTGTITPNINLTPSAAAPYTRIVGYETDRADKGNNGADHRPVLQAAGAFYIFTASSGMSFENLVLDGGTTGGGITSGNSVMVSNLKVSRFGLRGLTMGSNTTAAMTDVEITGGVSGCTFGVSLGQQAAIQRFWIHGNACTGLVLGSGSVAVDGVIAENTGANTDGVSMPTAGGYVAYVTIAKNGRYGIYNGSTYMASQVWRNNVIALNGNYGIQGATAAGVPALASWDGNCFYNNGAADNSKARNNLDDSTTNRQNGVAPYGNAWNVMATADPFVDSAGGNYALRADSQCKAAAVPGSYPGSSMRSWRDMGGVQHQDTGGGSGGGGGSFTFVR